MSAHKQVAIELAAALSDFLVETRAVTESDAEQIFDILADGFEGMQSEHLHALASRIAEPMEDSENEAN